MDLRYEFVLVVFRAAIASTAGLSRAEPNFGSKHRASPCVEGWEEVGLRDLFSEETFPCPFIPGAFGGAAVSHALLPNRIGPFFILEQLLGAHGNRSL